MNTRAIELADYPAECAFERVDDSGKGFMCGVLSRIVWLATAAQTRIPLCRQCHDWLLTMESLGLKVD